MQDVLLEDSPLPGVVCLRLNRPEVRNALDLRLRHALADAFIRLDANPEVRVVVLAGGEKAFCAGADLGEYVAAEPVEILERRMGRLWDAIASCGKPVIAAVKGYAIGGGCELAMHADIIIAGEGASFGQPEVKLGIMPGGGATQRLTQAVGKFAAMNLLLRGRPIPAQTALALGMVSEMVPDAQVEPQALLVAGELAALPVQALRLIKEAVLEGLNGGLASGLQLERRSFQMLFSTQDKTEGMRALLETRPPRFSGR